jgi:hypothetical protein
MATFFSCDETNSFLAGCSPTKSPLLILQKPTWNVDVHSGHQEGRTRKSGSKGGRNQGINTSGSDMITGVAPSSGIRFMGRVAWPWSLPR